MTRGGGSTLITPSEARVFAQSDRPTMTSFSERMGITQPKTIQIDNLDAELRNSASECLPRIVLYSNKN